MPDQFWQEWVKLLGVLAVPLGILIWAIAWLMKSIVTHALSRDIVRLSSESAKEIEQMKILSTREIEEIKIKPLHEAELSKIQLNTKLIEEMEQLKSNLTIIMKEHEIRFSGLHRERAETIKNLRSKIVDAYYESMHFSNEIGSALDSKLPFIEEKEGKVSDNELVERLKEPYEKSWSKIGEASAYALQNSVYFSRDLYERIRNLIELLQHDHLIFLFSPDDPEFLLKGYEDDRKDLIKQHNERDKLLTEIDDEFRALLGVDNATHSKS